jgi:hypothetical protein
VSLREELEESIMRQVRALPIVLDTAVGEGDQPLRLDKALDTLQRLIAVNTSAILRLAEEIDELNADGSE